MNSNEELVKLNNQLQSKIEELSKALIEKDKNIAQLRLQMDSEINELTSNLFTEATNMVNNAKLETININQRYEEASMRLEIFEEEVKQLKKKIEVAAKMEDELVVNINGSRKNAHSPRSFMEKVQKNCEIDIKILQVDMIVYNTFVGWIESKCSFHEENAFIKMIIEEDVIPSMKFPNRDLSKLIIKNIIGNKLFIENMKGHVDVVRICDLCHAMVHCPYKVIIDDHEIQSNSNVHENNKHPSFYQISDLCRCRIVSLIELFNYLRYISHGLVRCDSKFLGIFNFII